MNSRTLGESGLSVSPLGLGTWAMGATVETWGHVDDNESIAAINAALDAGVNLIDTAPIYGLGHAEEVVGRALRGRRNQAVLATKCGLLFPRSPQELPPRCLKPESVIRECEASLRRLRTEVIDLYQCHWPDPDTPISETMAALNRLREQGKIRAVGVSNFSCEQIAAAREYGPVCCLQPPLSMLQRRAAEDLLPFCQEHRMGAIVYSPLCKGLLTGKFDASSRFSDVRARDPEFLGARYRTNLRIVEALRPIAARYQKSVGQLALQWVISRPGVTAAIMGAKRVSQVMENVGAIGWSITDEDLAEIKAILESSTREP